MPRYGTGVKYGSGAKYGPGDTPDIPAAPDGLMAVAISTSQIDLTWYDNSGNETGFEVQRRTGAGAYATVATLAANAANWSNTTGLSPSTTYTYRVRALGGAGNSGWSNEATVTTPAAPVTIPAAPTGLSATAISSTQVNLAWTDASTNETSFEVQRRRGTDAWATIASPAANATSLSDTAAVAGTTYTYRVRAVNSAGASAWSNEASATTPAAPVTVPAAPSSLVATVIHAGLVTLTWLDNADNEASEQLQRRIGAGAWADLVAALPANTTSRPDTTTTYATTYTYRVRAVNSAGASAWSNEASVTTPAAPAAASSGEEVQVWVGPLRGQAPLPVVEEGADWTPAPGWEEVSSLAIPSSVDFQEHEHLLTLSLPDWAMDTATFADDRQVIVRGRWRDSSNVYVAWRVVFAGYVTGRLSGEVSGDQAGIVRRGTLTCAQEWGAWSKLRLPPVTFGWTDLARGASATASSTLTDPSAEAGLEYLAATSVDAGQAIDGNLNTLWVANTLADPTPPTLLATGQTVRLIELYNGRGNAGVPGANGRPLWMVLWCAHLVASEGFESAPSGTAGWQSIRGGVITRSTAWGANGSTASMRIQAPAAGGAASKDFGGLTPQVEVAVSFTLRSATGAALVLDVGVAGDGPTVWRKLTAPTQTSGRRYRMRVPANRHGVVNLRFSSTADGQLWYVDDVRIAGGLDLVEDGQPYRKLWLVWENGLGQSGYADISNYLDGLTAIGGDRAIVLTDDVDLFRQWFDAGSEVTVIGFRGLSQLAALDFATGRGRLRLAWYRRWPDLPGDGGAVWDDVQLSALPAFGATQSLRRTQISPATWVLASNPAPGGEPASGPAWLNVDLGTYAGPALTAALGTAASEIALLDSTEKLPAYGYLYIEAERVWAAKLSATTLQLTRTAPVAHGVGAAVAPELDGVRVVYPPVAALGWRRRPGTPALEDFDLIGSLLPSPRDPSVPDAGGGVWGEHDDWFPLATVRGYNEPTWTAVIGRAGDWLESSWPPPAGWAQGWGRQLRHVRLVIHRMQAWAGAPQRAKLNSLHVYEADLGSGGAGEWASTHPPDLRGVIGHLLVQHAGLPPAQLRIDRGRGDGVAWGGAYGQLPIAPSTLTEALTQLEAQGLLRIICTATGLVRVVPDPHSTSAAFQAAAKTWTLADFWRLAAAREEAHRVSQARVTGRHQVTGAVYEARYPRTPGRLGEIVEVTDAILGGQAAAEALAARTYRKAAARWSATIETGMADLLLPTPYSRHVVAGADGDRAGVEPAGRSFLAEGYSWRWSGSEYGGQWTVSINLREVAGWSG